MYLDWVFCSVCEEREGGALIENQSRACGHSGELLASVEASDIQDTSISTVSILHHTLVWASEVHHAFYSKNDDESRAELYIR